jgi:hypothetical protein
MNCRVNQQEARKNRQNHHDSDSDSMAKPSSVIRHPSSVVHLKTKTRTRKLHLEGNKKLCAVAVQALSSSSLSTRRQLVVNSSSTRR